MASSRPQGLRILYDSMIAPGLQRTPPSSETSSKPTSRHLEETEYSEAGSDAVKSWLNEVQTDMHLGMVSRNPRSLTYKVFAYAPF